MAYDLVQLALLLHVAGWGLGAAVLAMPRRWGAFWPVLVFPAGWTLQSLVVWLGAYANLPGTVAYAGPAESVPVLLLAVAAARRPLRRLGPELGRFGLVLGASVISSLVLVWPLTQAARALTTASLGSCDAADYAAGARTLMQFAHSDRSGFLGLTEVVRVMSADNFFDFWLRLNHFTPAALLALNGAILRLESYQLTSILTAALLGTSLPVVFWLARAGLRLRRGPSLAVALAYGLSPVTWYAVYHVAMGQLLAAQAIALLTWGGFALWRRRAGAGGVAPLAGVLLIGYLLILGSYNFILVVAPVPAVAFAAGRALAERAPARLGRWLVALLAPLAVAAAIYFTRTAGLMERFQLLGQYDFGWKIPVLGPAGWLGLVGGVGLEPYGGAGPRVGQLLLLAALAAGGVAAGRRNGRAAWALACCAGPVLAGYYFLEWRGARFGTNASYDAYKLLAVFYPGLLAALVAGLTGWAGAGGRGRGAGFVLAGLWLAGLAISDRHFLRAMRHPPLLVGPGLVQLESLEANPRIESVNLYIPDMWSRLWANNFLLRKPQYFPTHTYEGRLNTPLRGRWDLHGGVIEVRLPAAGSEAVNPVYSLTDTRSPHFVRAEFGPGWYDLESLPRSPTVWRWSAANGEVAWDNPQEQALAVAWEVDARSLAARDFTVRLNGETVGTLHVGPERAIVAGPPFRLPSGRSRLELAAVGPVGPAGPGDSRALGLAAYHLAFSIAPGGP